MRTVSSVRWAACALALSILPASVVPASADRSRRSIPRGALPPAPPAEPSGSTPPVSRRSISACASFDQVDHGEDRVAFTIHNTCSIPVDCAVSWRVVCAPDTNKRRASHPGGAKLAIPEGASQSTEASAAICGDDAWAIDSVVWSCQPNKD